MLAIVRLIMCAPLVSRHTHMATFLNLCLQRIPFTGHALNLHVVKCVYVAGSCHRGSAAIDERKTVKGVGATLLFLS